MKFTSKKLGGRELALAQVTVLLGANGSGKSTVLHEIKSQVESICPGKRVLYVEGGRAITLNNSLKLNAKNVNQYGDYSRAKRTYEDKRQSSLSARVFDALMMLESKELAIKVEHSDAVQVWQQSGQNGSAPTRESPPLERLFEQFHEIFPRVHIKYNAEAKSINARKNDAEYPIQGLSDGEKQVFSILADFMELGAEFGLVVVDEPELNLHPELAERVWNLIEVQYPEKVFVYATHSLGFGMRRQVLRVIIISDDPDNIVVLEAPTELSTIDLRRFLGSIPGIIAASKVIVTEGDDRSFDSVFYRWLLADDQVEVVPVGDCEQVLNVCRRDGVWSKIAAKVRLVGVIDGDLRPRPSSLAITLDFRDAESFLAIPELVVAVDTHLAVRPKRVGTDSVIDIILRQLEQERRLICANLVAARCGIRLGVSVRKSVLKECNSRDELLQHLTESSQEELAKAATALGRQAIEEWLNSGDTEIDRIISASDWKAALHYVDGKRVANAVARLVGLPTSIELIRCVATNIALDRIPEINTLSSAIRQAVST